jgi:hypothetical protein
MPPILSVISIVIISKVVIIKVIIGIVVASIMAVKSFITLDTGRWILQLFSFYIPYKKKGIHPRAGIIKLFTVVIYTVLTLTLQSVFPGIKYKP